MTIDERIDAILSDGRWSDVLPDPVIESAGRILLVAEVREAA